MSFTTPVAVSVFLLGAVSGSLLVSLRYLALRDRIHAEVAEDLRRALFRKYREEFLATPGRIEMGAVDLESYESAADGTDGRVGWP